MRFLTSHAADHASGGRSVIGRMARKEPHGGPALQSSAGAIVDSAARRTHPFPIRSLRSRFDYVSIQGAGAEQEVPDWRHRAEYIRTRSTRKESAGETDIEPEWADEAFTDPYAVIFSPDPASRRGQSDRTIGWSETAGILITIITVREGAKLWGANAWKSNDVDQRHYQRNQSVHQDVGQDHADDEQEEEPS